MTTALDTRTEYQRKIQARNAVVANDYAELTAEQPTLSHHRRCLALARKYRLSVRQIDYIIKGH